MEPIATNDEHLADPLWDPSWTGSHADHQDRQRNIEMPSLRSPGVNVSNSWQSDKDRPHRREMIENIVNLLKRDEKGSPPDTESLNDSKPQEMAEKVELLLYRSAPSLEAYVDSATLKARVEQQIIAMEVGHHGATIHDDDAEESESDEDEKLVPDFSYYRKIATFWCCQLRYPTIVCIVNMIILGLAFHVLANSIDWYGFDAEEDFIDIDLLFEEDRSAQTRMIKQNVGFALLALTFLVDCWIFWKGAKRLEQQVLLTQTNKQSTASLVPVELENLESSDEDQPTKVDFVALSRSIDFCFGCRISGPPNTTFIVSLLYALFSVTAWLAALSGASLSALHVPQIDHSNVVGCAYQPFSWYKSSSSSSPWKTPKQLQHQVGFGFLQRSSEFPNLPTDVQAWINASTKYIGGSAAAKEQPYLALANGTLIFPFNRDGRLQRGIVVNANGSAREYWGPSSNYKLTLLVGFPKEQPYDAWCCVFGGATREFQEGKPVIQDAAFCRNKTGHMRGFGPITAAPIAGANYRVFGPMIYSSDDMLWVVRGRQSLLPYSYHGIWKGEAWISLVSYNMSTVERTMVLQRNETNEFTYNEEKKEKIPALRAKCRDWGWIMASVSLTVFGSLFMFLYRLGVPSCAGPLCGIFTMLLHGSSLSTVWANGATFFAICTCIYLLKRSKRFSKRNPNAMWKDFMLVWVLHSLLATSLLPFWRDVLTSGTYGSARRYWKDVLGRRLLFATPTFVLGLVVALVLNHPVFEILAFSCAMAAVCSMCLFAVNYDPIMLVLPPVLLILSLGCFQAGGILRRYRLHIIVFARRGWRAIWRCCCHSMQEVASP